MQRQQALEGSIKTSILRDTCNFSVALRAIYLFHHSLFYLKPNTAFCQGQNHFRLNQSSDQKCGQRLPHSSVFTSFTRGPLVILFIFLFTMIFFPPGIVILYSSAWHETSHVAQFGLELTMQPTSLHVANHFMVILIPSSPQILTLQIPAT